MIELRTTGDFVTVFILAGVAGLIGGLAAELLLNRNGETGAFEMPARKGALFDMGGFASLLIGAVTGIAILIVFPPETSITTTAGDGATTTVRSYDTVRLVATAVIAGSAGGSVLTALQSRVTAAVRERELQWQQAQSLSQLESLADRAKDETAAAVRAVSSAPTPSPEVRARGGVLEDLPGGSGPGRAQLGALPEEAIAGAANGIDHALASAKAAMKRTPYGRP